MAALVGTTKDSNTSGVTQVILPKVTGVASGDLMLAHIVAVQGATITGVPSGWALVRASGDLRTYSKVATGSEPASYSWSISASNFHAGVLQTWRGATGIAGSLGWNGNATSSRQVTAPSISGLAGQLLVCVWAADTFTTTTVSWAPPPSGMSEALDANSHSVTALAAYQELAADGATGSKTATYEGGNASRPAAAHTLLLATNTAPNAPILLAPADASTIDRTATQRFDWDFSDPDDGDTQSAYNLRYRVVGAATWAETGWISTPNTYRDIAGGTFADGADYEWQVATKDGQGVEGPFSSSSFFTAASPSSPATITYPTSGGTVNQTDRVDWSTPTQESYQVRRVADNAGPADTATVYYDSGEVVSTTARTHALDFATNNRYEHVQVRIKEGGLWSAWSSIRVLVSYTPPPTPTVTPGADDSAGAVVVTYSTPAPAAGEPTVEYADVEVRDTSGRDRYRAGEGIRIGTLLTPSGTFIDWLPAAGVNYEYRVIAFGDNGTTSASAWTPIDAEALASVYYGGSY